MSIHTLHQIPVRQQNTPLSMSTLFHVSATVSVLKWIRTLFAQFSERVSNASCFSGFVSNLDRSIILSKFVVSGVSRCPRFHTGAKHHNTFRERVNSVRNTCEQVTQFSRLDGCVAYQILHLCQARAFLSVSRGSHTRASFQMCSIAFTAFLFSRRATDAVFRKTRHLATFRRTRQRKFETHRKRDS